MVENSIFNNNGDCMKAKNVIVTSYRLSAIGWFTGVLSEIHKAIYGDHIKWGYEISRFECTRDRRPLPMGWNTVWLANPLTLAKRGFDKVLVVKRPIEDILEACCWYDYQKSHNNMILNGGYERYLNTIRRNYSKLYDIEYEHPNIYNINIEHLNINPVENFKRLCKFLEFDLEKFPIIIPIKVQKDWQVYAGYNVGELNERLKMIKESKARRLFNDHFELENTRLNIERERLQIMGKVLEEMKDAKQKSKTQIKKEEI